MNFVEIKSLTNTFYRISSYLDYLETLAIDNRSVDSYQDYIYRVAFSIRLCVDDFIANNCYLAIPGLVLDINDGMFHSKSQTIEQWTDDIKGRLLRLSSQNDKVYNNVVDIISKGSFFEKYSIKLIHDIANENVENLLIK